MSKKDIEQIPVLIQQLYAIVDKLESYFPGRHFTPDGHLVGSIGEVLAASHYNLRLLPASVETHDAVTRDGKLIQIKATQGKSIGLRSEPEYLIVLKILKDGTTNEIYNGPGKIAWVNSGSMQKNGQRNISISKLVQLMKTISLCDRVPRESI
jgi:hypothetical protein